MCTQSKLPDTHGRLIEVATKSMAGMTILQVLLAVLGSTQILRAEPSVSPAVKNGGGSSLASVVAGGSKPARPWDKPSFDDISQKNVTAIVGQKAALSCHVKHPGNRTVNFGA
ncbi:uncharacterized protein [Chelonus insularis]|uniref:uncharacterized protein n=1 Tax=Chelonus insularis TaxID=460826 RepID=UPI001589FAC8|nr:uncharacterized protein LOC118069360 [Chelonus insularis]